MITAVLLFAVTNQTVTFTHACDRSSVVLEALGEELGMIIKPSGSVNDDYFLVRFDDVPVQEALDKIAETLNATWVERRGTRYLERTRQQEKAEVEKSVAIMRKDIKMRAAALESEPIDLEGARRLVTNANGLVADSQNPRERLRELRYHNAASAFLYRAAEHVPLEPFFESDLHSFVLFGTPNWLGQRWSQKIDPLKASMIQEEIVFQRALEELASPILKQYSPWPQRGRAYSELDRYAIQISMGVNLTLHLWRREDDSQRSRALAFMADPRAIAPAPVDIESVKIDWAPSQDERKLIHMLRDEKQRTAPLTKEEQEFVEGIFDTENGDPLGRFASSQLLALAGALDANVVALMPDDLLLQSSAWLSEDEIDTTRVMSNLYWAGLAVTHEQGWLTMKPIHPTVVRRDRIDRKEAHRFFNNVGGTLADDVALRASLATVMSQSAYGDVTGMYSMIYGRTSPPTAQFDYHFMRILGSLPLQQRAAALKEGIDVPLSGLSGKQMSSVRAILTQPYSKLHHIDDLGKKWTSQFSTDGKVPLQLWWDEPPKDVRFQVFSRSDAGYVVKSRDGSRMPAVDPEYVGTVVALWENSSSDRFVIDTSQVAVVDREGVFLQLRFDNGYVARTIINKPVDQQSLQFIPWSEAPSDFHERYRVGLEKARDLFNQGG